MINNRMNVLGDRYTEIPMTLVDAEGVDENCVYVDDPVQGRMYFYENRNPIISLSEESPITIFYELRGHKCEVFERVLIPCPPIKQVKDILLEDPIPVYVVHENSYTIRPDGTVTVEKPAAGMYDWVQSTTLTLDTSGSYVQRTDETGGENLISVLTPDTQSNISYFSIANEPGAVLPSTGGRGTQFFTILGSILILGAGVLLWRRQRLI